MSSTSGLTLLHISSIQNEELVGGGGSLMGVTHMKEEER
jgi:hypothetical protein